MHDPMVVAFDIPSPIPRRSRWRDGKGPRWGVKVSRRTNPEHIGQRVYPWWRLKGYQLFTAGKAWELGDLATIWHVEPGGADSGTVCKHSRRWQDDTGKWHAKRLNGWKWHVHHWKIRVRPLQKLKRSLFERCTECGGWYRWGYAPVAHGWNTPNSKWFRVEKRAYHHRCSSLVSMRNNERELHDSLLQAMAALAVAWDVPIDAVPRRLHPGSDGYRGDRPGVAGDFNLRRRLEHLLEKRSDEGGTLHRAKVRHSDEKATP